MILDENTKVISEDICNGVPRSKFRGSFPLFPERFSDECVILRNALIDVTASHVSPASAAGAECQYLTYSAAAASAAGRAVNVGRRIITSAVPCVCLDARLIQPRHTRNWHLHCRVHSKHASI